MNIIGIIPARMASTRFPNKPMANILGMPMIGHCLKRSLMCNLLTDVYVATCDKIIYDYIESIGGKAIMTLDTHERASDRTAEAMLKIEKKIGKKIDIVVLLQGDEPMTNASMIESAVKPLLDDSNLKITNLYTTIGSIEEFENPNEVKVVIDRESNALYFSREPIPTNSKLDSVPMSKQVCIIPFKKKALIEYIKLKPTYFEIKESVDMWRLLENNLHVKMIHTKFKSYAVDTKEDLKKVSKIMKTASFK